MKLNSSTRIIGKKVILVPYKQKHVPKYHTWMQKKELQETTASEPLSVEEEYAMQQSWFLDDDKCTFIILDKNALDSENNEIDAMIGDTNLYLSTEDDLSVAECAIMIAEKSERKQGKGLEATVLMLKYGIEFLKINKFLAKIGLSNSNSIRLFHKIGFETIGECKIFSEATLSVNVTDEWKSGLDNVVPNYSIERYEE